MLPTAVLIGHVAAATRTLRVGSGGIMLPNHAPLVVAEQFGTLEALYPDASISALDGRPEATSIRCGRCDATFSNPAMTFLNCSRSCAPILVPECQARPSRQFPGREAACPLHYSAQATSVRALPHLWDFHLPLLHTLPPICCCMRRTFTAVCFGRVRHCSSHGS